MRSSNSAKFALTALVVCANAHCGKPQLTVDRLADIFLGKTDKISRAEQNIVKDILRQADPQLLDKAWKEAGGKGPGLEGIAQRLGSLTGDAKNPREKSTA